MILFSKEFKFQKKNKQIILIYYFSNLSTIVKRSEQILTPKKSSNLTTVRRTSSLHINNRENLSNSFVKTSNSHHDTLTDSNLDLSRLNTQRRSIRNIEKFSGIKCSLPSGTSTLPTTFKGFDKHCTPIKTKPTDTSSFIVSLICLKKYLFIEILFYD